MTIQKLYDLSDMRFFSFDLIPLTFSMYLYICNRARNTITISMCRILNFDGSLLLNTST